MNSTIPMMVRFTSADGLHRDELVDREPPHIVERRGTFLVHGSNFTYDPELIPDPLPVVKRRYELYDRYLGKNNGMMCRVFSYKEIA